MADTDSDWRHQIDPLLKAHLEALVKETTSHKDAYHKAKNAAKAQLWTANAIQQKQIVELSLRIKFLEKVLADMSKDKKQNGNAPAQKKKEEPDVDAAKALKEVLKKL